LFLSDSLQKERIENWNNYWDAGKKQQLISDLKREGALLKFRESAFNNFNSLLDKNYAVVDHPELADIRKNFLDDYIMEKPGQASVVTLLKTSVDSKQSVIEKFDNRPEVTVLDRQYLTTRLTQIVNDDFNRIAWFTCITDHVWPYRTGDGFFYSHAYKLDMDTWHYGHHGNYI
jgi:uncharacterized protein